LPYQAPASIRSSIGSARVDCFTLREVDGARVRDHE
jgi:hypothetical protein